MSRGLEAPVATMPRKDSVALFRWTPERKLAAQLVAKGGVSGSAIGSQCSVTRRTIFRWRQNSVFSRRVREIRGGLDEARRREWKAYLLEQFGPGPEEDLAADERTLPKELALAGDAQPPAQPT